MKKGRVVNLNFLGGAIGFTVKNKILIILTSFFIIGITFGVFTFGKYNFVSQYITLYLQNFINLRLNSSFINILLDSLFESLIFILFSFCIGTSMFGTVLILPLVLFRSFCYGSVVALLYSQYGIKGIAFNAIIVLPYSIFFIIAFLFSCCESVKFSLLLANQTFSSGEYKNLSLCFKSYCLRHCLFLIPIVFSALLDALISMNFLSDFKII